LNVLRFDDYSEEWLAFIVLNRKNEAGQQAHDYDIVEGPVANDKIATEVDRYYKQTEEKDSKMKAVRDFFIPENYVEGISGDGYKQAKFGLCA